MSFIWLCSCSIQKLSTLRDQMVEWDLQFKALQELEHAEETLSKLRLHLAWARYLHTERDRERQSKRLERIDLENNQLNEKIENLRVRAYTLNDFTLHLISLSSSPEF